MSARYTPPADQPLADYYQMLGVVHFENDSQVIRVAADGRIIHVRSFQSGPHVEQIVQELNVARSMLLDPQLKALYDAQLHQQLYPPATPSLPPSPALAEQSLEFTANAPALSTTAMGSTAEDPGLDFSTPLESSFSTRPRSRRSKRALWLAIGLNILGPVLGLCGGYAVLCWISPQYDFLHLLPPERVSPASASESLDPEVPEEVSPSHSQDDPLQGE